MGFGIGAAAFVCIFFLILLSPFPTCRLGLVSVTNATLCTVQWVLAVATFPFILSCKKPIPPPENAEFLSHQTDGTGPSGSYTELGASAAIKKLLAVGLIAIFWPVYLFMVCIDCCCLCTQEREEFHPVLFAAPCILDTT